MRALMTLGLCTLVLAAVQGDAREASADRPGPESAAREYAQLPVGRLDPGVEPRAYRLHLIIDPEETRFQGDVEIDVGLAFETDLVWLHGDGLSVDEASATTGAGERIAARYEQVDETGVARLDFEAPLKAGDATLRLTFSAPFATVPAGLFRSERRGESYVASQLEAISGRKIFPSFDEPSFKVPFYLSITAPSAATVVTTTPLVATDDLGDGRSRRFFATTPPLPTYLLAFVVGPYDVNEWAPVPPNEVRKRPLPLRGVAVAGQGARMDYALENTDPLLRALEDYFDIPHPYPKLDLVAAPGYSAAMENVGAIIYTEYLMLLDEQSALEQRRQYFRVHAHELAHQWFGNYVTPAWWNDIWLNEAFATWMANKVAAQTWPEGQFERSGLRFGLYAMGADSLASARRIREPVERNASITDAFDSITYQKGGAVLGMFEAYLGDAAFRDGVRLHMSRFANGVATAEDFMRSLADGSRRPEVIPAFRSFIEQPGVPLVEARLRCDGPPTLEITQSRYAPLGSRIDPDRTWHIPLCVAAGSTTGVGRTCALIAEEKTSLPLDVTGCPSFVVPNGDGFGYFRFALDETGWTALARAANALDAAQALAYADSLDAAFRADAASAAALLDGLAALSRHDAWDVLTEAMDRYEGLVDLGLDEELRAALQQLGRGLFRPVYDRLRPGSDPAVVLLQTSLTRFLALVAYDPDVRSELLAGARRYVGIGADPAPGALDADLVETALSVGVQEDGQAFFDELLALVRASGDPALRANGIGALARTADPMLTTRLFEAVSADDFSRGEFMRVLYRQMARPESRAAAWDWIQENYDLVLERSPGVTGGRTAVAFGRYLCSPGTRREYEDLLRRNDARLAGHQRARAQALESIDLCIALRAAKDEQLRVAVAARL
jgi:aminopeptidase N